MNNLGRLALLLTTALVVLVMAACSRQEIEAGPIGPAGPAGPVGPPGPAGENATASQEYVGSESCSECHEALYEKFMRSGHPYDLTRIEGEPPGFPYDDVTGGIAQPPAGYTWDDISYVIGGFGWKALFTDQNGYVITGVAGADDGSGDTQYNFANEELDAEAGWVAFHAGEEIPFDCGVCHTTGYQPEGHQEALEGVVGMWQFEGVQCERCHGPGSRHAADPYGVQMVLDRSSQLCGECHTREDPAVIQAGNGFQEHNQQFADLYNSQHFALSCVTCHDPHATTIHATDEEVADREQRCLSCHWSQATQKIQNRHFALTCTTCHMPPMAVSAQAVPEEFSGDIHSHQFAINTDPAAPQFSEDGSRVMPYITLQYACQQCHNGSFYSAQDLEKLSLTAQDYHELPPTETPTPTPTPTMQPEEGAETPTPAPTP